MTSRKKFSLENLQSAFADKTSNNTSNNNDDWFNIATQLDVDSQVVLRLVDDKDQDNAFGAFVKTSRHGFKIGDEWKSIVCSKHTHNLDCPICEASANFYKEGDTVRGKEIYKKDKILTQVIIMEHDNKDLVGQFKFISLTMPLFKQILEDMSDLEHEAWDYQMGSNLIIKKTHDGKFNNYNAKFARKESAISDEYIETAKNNMVELSSLVPEPADDTAVSILLDEYLDSIN